MQYPGEHNPRPGSVPGAFNLEQEPFLPFAGVLEAHRSSFFVHAAILPGDRHAE